jgi:hypothetical protein
MTSILLISSNGTIKPLKTKEIAFDTLYKKCGFKSSDDFDRRTSWNTTIEGAEVIVELWAKDDGKANTENKYDFPPPVDNALYFGTCALVRLDKKTGNIINLTDDIWLKVYEKLFGGFEDIGDEDEYSEDELEHVSKELKTKKGYLKDGFVVEDEDEDEDEDSDDDDEDSDDDDEAENEHDGDGHDLVSAIHENDTDEHADDGSELEEEEYMYSDDD